MAAGTAPRPATSRHALSTVRAHSWPAGSVANTEQDPAEEADAMYDLKPAVAAKAIRTAINCPSG